MPKLYLNGWSFAQTVWPSFCRSEDSFFHDLHPWPAPSSLDSMLELLSSTGKRVTLLGWSLGGMLSLEAAARRPWQIEKLILISTTPRFLTTKNYACGLDENSLRNLKRQLNRNPQKAVRTFQQGIIDGSSKEPDFSAQEISSLKMGLDYLEHTDLRPLLPGIDIPCHIIHGTADRICPYQAGLSLAAALPRATLHTMKDCAHAPFLNDPLTFKVLLESII